MAHGAEQIPVGNLIIEAPDVWIRRLITLLSVQHGKPQKGVDTGLLCHIRTRHCGYQFHSKQSLVPPQRRRQLRLLLIYINLA
jgi:hypothetical protein